MTGKIDPRSADIAFVRKMLKDLGYPEANSASFVDAVARECRRQRAEAKTTGARNANSPRRKRPSSAPLPEGETAPGPCSRGRAGLPGWQPELTSRQH